METLAFEAPTPLFFGGVGGFMVPVMRATLRLGKPRRQEAAVCAYTRQSIWGSHGSLAQIITRAGHPTQIWARSDLPELDPSAA